jgi:predicted nucleic acid-binding protein
LVAAALDIFRGSLRLEFSDCLILELARRSGHGPLGTFDKRLAKAEGAELLGS